jgi:hypothetical protein
MKKGGKFGEQGEHRQWRPTALGAQARTRVNVGWWEDTVLKPACREVQPVVKDGAD